MNLSSATAGIGASRKLSHVISHGPRGTGLCTTKDTNITKETQSGKNSFLNSYFVSFVLFVVDEIVRA